MEFIDKDLDDYIVNHTSKESKLLQQVNRETWTNVLMPRMLSGHLQGRVLSMLSHMIKPKRVLEIGTYTGYSAICLAEGMSDEGFIHTIDVNEELEDLVKSYLKEAKLENKSQYHIGNAMEIIPNINEKWDLVFIDADKDNYSNYFDLVIEKMNKGGFIIADNVLWSGKVIEKFRDKLDKDTEALMEFNEKVHRDTRVENVLFPIRDGLMVLRKI